MTTAKVQPTISLEQERRSREAFLAKLCEKGLDPGAI
jgi:hypothetical protein